LDVLKLVVEATGAILIPVVLLIVGQWFTRQKERSDKAQREADLLAHFLDHLSSENADKRKLALLILKHLQDANRFPAPLLEAVQSIAATDNPSVAAAARIALGEVATAKNFTLLSELLLPMKVHFDRTRDLFKQWVSKPASKPNEQLEEFIKQSNMFIRNLLMEKGHLVPGNLQPDALKLIEHYEAWLREYDRVRPGGVRDPNVPWVFVGPQGVPFPIESEKRFMELYEELTGKGT
jgi:hypothetical protein